MGKPTGFIDYEREDAKAIEPKERIKNFKEFHIPLSMEKQQIQGARCMNCGVPFCQSGMTIMGMTSGCPLHNLVPEWNDLVYTGNWEQAYNRLKKTNNFPEFTSRVCPALCEAACTCGHWEDPVTCKANEHGIIENAYAKGYAAAKPPRVRTGKKVAIIGSGPAGLAAAVAAKDNGIDNILILERDKSLGGILQQCIHNGFGLHTFKEELTGPEYAARFIEQVEERGIEYKLNTMVMDISPEKVVTATNREDGILLLQANAIILAMGCRERSRGALNIPGYRPAGIYSAGTAQHLVNMEGLMPGKEVVILGSGDIGLIMARRMTLEGAKVKVVAELMPYSGGLKRNIVQCLDDFEIPLKLSHTVIDIEGKHRVEAVTIAEVGPDRKPIPGTEERYTCDTLLLSCGLLPENELSKSAGVELSQVTSGPVVNDSLETSVDGIFACGNVLHVHDLVDFVSQEAAAAGKNAAAYIKAGEKKVQAEMLPISPEGGVRYTVPSFVRPSEMEENLTVRFRVGDVYKNKAIVVYFDDQLIGKKKRQVMAPGEMEQVILKKKKLEEYPETKKIMIRIEEA